MLAITIRGTGCGSVGQNGTRERHCGHVSVEAALEFNDRVTQSLKLVIAN